MVKRRREQEGGGKRSKEEEEDEEEEVRHTKGIAAKILYPTPLLAARKENPTPHPKWLPGPNPQNRRAAKLLYPTVPEKAAHKE